MWNKRIHRVVLMAGLGTLLIAARPAVVRGDTMGELMARWMALAGEFSELRATIFELRVELRGARQDYIDAMGAFAATGEMRYRAESRVALNTIRELTADIVETEEAIARVLGEMADVQRAINEESGQPHG